MRVALAALLIGAPCAPVMAEVGKDALPGIFVHACLDGQVRLAAGEVTPASFDDLPSALRNRLKVPSTGQVWRLNTAGRSYLYMLSYDPRRGADPKICGIASDSMSLDAAGDAVEARIAGVAYARPDSEIQWLRPQDGYVVTAANLAGFKVVHVNWLSEEKRKAALAALRNVE